MRQARRIESTVMGDVMMAVVVPVVLVVVARRGERTDGEGRQDGGDDELAGGHGETPERLRRTGDGFKTQALPPG
jgi:hypothetical protein